MCIYHSIMYFLYIYIYKNIFIDLYINIKIFSVYLSCSKG